MIIAHFFLRDVKEGRAKRHVLFVETTSSQGLEQPCPAARPLVDVSMRTRRQEWVKKAYYAFSEMFPELVLVDAMENSLRLESDHPSFDLVFRPKAMPPSATESLAESARDASITEIISNMKNTKEGSQNV